MSELEGIGPPRQARSRETYERILKAATELLAERRYEDISVDEIAARAGYTKGAFYHRFESKTVLLRHLIARLVKGALDEWDTFLNAAAWKDESLRNFLAAFIERLVTIYGRSHYAMRALSWEANWGTDAAIRALAADLNAHVRKNFVAILRARKEELTPDARANPEEAARLWLTSLTALLQFTYFWRNEALAPDDDPQALRQRAVRLFVPYLAG